MILNAPVILTLLIFFLTYDFIISEKINRTVVALIGATLILFANVINQEQAIQSIDFNTIRLLIGMIGGLCLWELVSVITWRTKFCGIWRKDQICLLTTL